MLIYEKRVYPGIHVPSNFIDQICNYHFSAKFIIFVALSNALYISTRENFFELQGRFRPQFSSLKNTD